MKIDELPSKECTGTRMSWKDLKKLAPGSLLAADGHLQEFSAVAVNIGSLKCRILVDKGSTDVIIGDIKFKHV